MLKSIDPGRSWYQFNSYWPTAFALVATQNDDGSPHLAPYQLVVPFDIAGRPSVALTTRDGAKTLKNILKNKYCSMNFIESENMHTEKIISMGYPRVSHEKRMEINPFTFIKHENTYIVDEAFQVYKCSFIDKVDSEDVSEGAVHILLGLDEILLEEKWLESPDEMPNMPVTFGYRGRNTFWFAETTNAKGYPVHNPQKKNM